MSKKSQKGVQPLSKEERNAIYNEVAFGLINLDIWNIEDQGMKKFKIMMKLYLDHGKEFNGEIDLESLDRKLIYNLYNDRRKKTVAYLSKDRYLKAIKAREKQEEKKITEQTKQMVDLPVDPDELKTLRELEKADN